MKLSHIDENGRAKMVDVAEKAATKRTATSEGTIKMKAETLALVRAGGMKKGDVLGTAKIAGIMGAKKTADLIPMCHNIFLEGCDIDFEFKGESEIHVTATVTTTSKTGVEMEALTAVSVALVTIYDMTKAVDKTMEITDIRLLEKTGGKSGDYKRN